MNKELKDPMRITKPTLILADKPPISVHSMTEAKEENFSEEEWSMMTSKFDAMKDRLKSLYKDYYKDFMANRISECFQLILTIQLTDNLIRKITFCLPNSYNDYTNSQVIDRFMASVGNGIIERNQILDIKNNHHIIRKIY